MRNWLYVAALALLLIAVAVACAAVPVAVVHKATPALLARYCAVYDDTVIDYGNCISIGWGTR